ncbi:MAG TPA: MFS transporter [Candidatus Saccharimonadales bacterium]|nr:MFS transporter [Candidatus Saccharimonadales bacterium]
MNAHILRVFSERSFLYLWIGEVFTQVSSNLFNFFLLFIVYKLTHSNTAVSGVVLSFTIPAIFFGSVAGVYVDRWNKKYVLIITNIVRAVLLVVLAFMLNDVVMIYLISLVFSIFVQFFIPAESPMIPLVVDKKYLLHANALFGLAIFGSILVAYLLSGPILIFFQPFKAIFLLAAMLVVGAIFIAFVKPKYGKVSPINKDDPKLNFLGDIKKTLSFVRHTRAISHSLFLLSLSQILILILATVAPGYASQVLGIPVEQFPIIFVTPAALGMVVGSIVLVNIFHNHPQEKVITAGIFLSGIAMLLLPFGSKVASKDIVHDINVYLPHTFSITILHIMVVLAFILGLANSFVFVPANTRLQDKTSDEIRGKIYGFLNTFIGVLSLVPIIAVGGLSDLIGVSAVITGIGISLLILGFINMYIS